MDQVLDELALFVADDHDCGSGERGDVVRAAATTEAPDAAIIARYLRAVVIAVLVHLERAEEPYVHHAAMEEHSHHVEEAAEHRGSVPVAGIGVADAQLDEVRVHDADLIQ